MNLTLKQIKKEDILIVKAWLINKDNNIWLDSLFRENAFDDARIAVMLLKKSNKTYVFEVQGKPAGVVGLTDIDLENRSGMLWYILGDKALARSGVTTQAVGVFIKMCFNEFNLYSIGAWSVSGNEASCRVLEKNGFKIIGKRRRCHSIDGVYKDRLLYDIVIEDFNRQNMV